MLALIYLTHFELYGAKVPFQTLQKKLRGLGRASILSNLAVINNIQAHSSFLGRGYKDLPEIQKLLKNAYLRKSVRTEIQRKGLQDRVVFLRFDNLYLAQLSILHSTDAQPVQVDGGTIGGFELGDCSLIASDYLLSTKEARNTETGTNRKRIRHLGFQLSPGVEISNPLDMMLGVVRSEIIYSEILDSSETREVIGEEKLNQLDLTAHFEKSVGLTIGEYIDITVGLLSYFLEKDGLNKIRTIEVDAFLAQSQLRREALESYLTLESRSVDLLKEQFKSQPRYINKYSFLPFKSYPLIEVQSGLFFCIDTFFLAEKLNAGLYWKIFDSLPSKKRTTLSEVFGHIFEIYVRRLLREVLNKPNPDPKKGLLTSDSRYENGDRNFDEVIYYPDTRHLIVIETKASFLHTQAKFGRSVTKFWNEIKQKFVEKEGGTGKGIGQLAKHIGSLFLQDKSKRHHVADKTLDNWIQNAEKVSPILIVQEPLLSFHINEDILNEEFKKRLKKIALRDSIKISNLTVLNIETLEKLRAHLIDKQVTLEQCLKYRNYRDSEYKSDFGSLVFEQFDLRRRTDEKIDTTFATVFKRATERLFGIQSHSKEE